MNELMVNRESRMEGVTLTKVTRDPATLTITYEFEADHGAWFSPADPLSGPDGWIRGLDKITGSGTFTHEDREQHERAYRLMCEWYATDTQLRLGSDVEKQATALWQPDTVPVRTVCAIMPAELMDAPPLQAAA